MAESLAPDKVHELRILEHVERNPDVTQADLATQLDVAVGTVNWYVKRLIRKGYIKATQLQRRRMRYLITPKGVAERTRLAVEYVQVSMYMYRTVRQQAKALVRQAREAGFDQVRIEGDGDLADVVRLTCLEQGVEVALADFDHDGIPVIGIRGAQLALRRPE